MRIRACNYLYFTNLPYDNKLTDYTTNVIYLLYKIKIYYIIYYNYTYT